MIRLLCIIMCTLMLSACTPIENENTVIPTDYITGVWVSYAELDEMLQQDFKIEFANAVQNCKARGITDMFVHVRPFCDSYYKSDYFPLRHTVICDFDVVEYMINECHNNDIRFHAWINPYRVKTSDSEVSTLPDDSIAKKWLSDENADNDKNVSTMGGIYLNPSSNEVKELVTNGIREIIDNYSVDGIHFDDYFYPTTEQDFDAGSYAEYCNKTKKPLSLDNWRRANINTLISGVYTAVKFKNKDTVFSISPSASLEENYNTHYADVSAWIESGCVDYIIPQLYFGFDYPTEKFRFDVLLRGWQNITDNSDVRLLIGLATYKINTPSEPDCVEWVNGSEIIKKQIEICKQNDNVTGHIYFSYTSMCKYL